MNFLKRSLKYTLVGLVLCAFGLSVGLLILHYKERKAFLNPFEQENRDWARRKLHLAAGSARERFLNTRHGLEEWFKSRREDLPDTSDLLQRAIAYLEEDKKPSADAGDAAESAPFPEAGAEASQAAPSPHLEAPLRNVAPPEPSSSGKSTETSLETPEAVTPGPPAPRRLPESETAEMTHDTTAVERTPPEASGAAPASETTPPPAQAEVPAVEKPSLEERQRVFAAVETHLRKGKRHCLGAMPGRPNAGDQAAKARTELDAAAELLSGYLETDPEDPDARKMLAEVTQYRDSLPEIKGEVPELPSKGTQVASLPTATQDSEKAASDTGTTPTGTSVKDDIARTRNALDAVVGVAGPRDRDRERFEQGKEHFRKGLEHYRRSAPGKPDWLLHLKNATPEFEKAQSLMQDYADNHPEDKEAQDLFLDVNRFLYDCYKRTPLDLKK